jgi:hypothetical protein
MVALFIIIYFRTGQYSVRLVVKASVLWEFMVGIEYIKSPGGWSKPYAGLSSVYTAFDF